MNEIRTEQAMEDAAEILSQIRECSSDQAATTIIAEALLSAETSGIGWMREHAAAWCERAADACFDRAGGNDTPGQTLLTVAACAIRDLSSSP